MTTEELEALVCTQQDRIEALESRKPRRPRRAVVVVVIAIVVLILGATTIPHTFTGGTPISAADMNENILHLYTNQVPVGTIMAWHKSMTNTPALPTNWVECNGQTISDADSPYNGQAVPNLNSTGRFLHGGTTSGPLQAESINQSGLSVDIGHTHGMTITGTIGGSDGTHTHAITDPGHTHTIRREDNSVPFGAMNGQGWTVVGGWGLGWIPEAQVLTHQHQSEFLLHQHLPPTATPTACPYPARPSVPPTIPCRAAVPRPAPST